MVGGVSAGAEGITLEVALDSICRDIPDSEETTSAEMQALVSGTRDAERELRPEVRCDVLDALKRARRFKRMKALSDRWITFETKQGTIRANGDVAAGKNPRVLVKVLGARGARLRLQALIELGMLPEAERLAHAFGGLFPASTEEVERLEVTGLIGRIYKQRYVNSRKLGAPKREALKSAIRAYAKGFDLSTGLSLWHGVNLMAMLRLAARDRVVAGGVDHDFRSLAETLLKLVDDPASAGDEWRKASAAEACIALERWGEACRWLAEFIAPDFGGPRGAFEVGSMLRQMQDIWELDKRPEGDPGRGIVAKLEAEAALRAVGGGRRVVPSAQAPADREDEQFLVALDDVLTRQGISTTTTAEWLETLKARSCGVAQVYDAATMLGVGSGFLVRGGDIGPWGDEIVFVTNFHVVNRAAISHSFLDALTCSGARAQFTHLVEPAEAGFSEILFESPAEGGLDVCVLRLTGAPPPGAAPIPVSTSLADGEPSAVTVLGYPLGGELKLAMENQAVVPTAIPYEIHYFAATLKGCSGGPVLDWRDLTLVGLHHAGRETLESTAPAETGPTRRPNIFGSGSRLGWLRGDGEGRRVREPARQQTVSNGPVPPRRPKLFESGSRLGWWLRGEGEERRARESARQLPVPSGAMQPNRGIKIAAIKAATTSG